MVVRISEWTNGQGKKRSKQQVRQLDISVRSIADQLGWVKILIQGSLAQLVPLVQVSELPSPLANSMTFIN